MSTPVSLESAIETSADAIYEELDGGVDSALSNSIAGWRALHGLDRLEEPLRVVARQAAFDVLLKSTLYEQYRDQYGLSALSSDPFEDFEAAEEETGDPAFRRFVLDDVAATAPPDLLEPIVDARHDLIESDEPAEEIGRLFESLTPQESRRKLGQFRTPVHVAELMAAWLVETGEERVLDPGMGACALAAASYREKQRRSNNAQLSDICGIDLNELAIVMGATALTLLDSGGPHDLRVGDFLDIEPGDVDTPVDAVISNPPYTRHHELDEEYKEHVNEAIEQEIGRDVSALSPMYAYFYYHATEFLAPGGRMSFITPSEFLETGYGEPLKQFLTEEFDVQALVLFDRDEDSKFDEAMTTSLVSFLEKSEGGSTDELARFVRVDGSPEREELIEAIDGEVEGETEWGYVNAVAQEELDADDKWTGLFDPIDLDTDELTELSELATVNRGIATGLNDYFCLTQDEVEEWGIDEQYLSKLVRNSRSVPGYDYRAEDWERQRDAGEEVWLLYHVDGLDQSASGVQDLLDGDNATLARYASGADSAGEPGDVVKYLQHGTSGDIGADSGYLARNRTPWYVVDRRDPAPILVTYMSRGGSRFVRNEVGARNLTNLHGIYPEVELSETELDALLAYLNSDFASDVIRRSGRTYSTGMDKIEPNELEGVPVLDPRGVDDATVEALAGLFDDLRDAAREGDDAVAAVREEIDAVLDGELQAE